MKQEEIRERIEDCILPLPTTRTWVTRNIAQQISRDIVACLHSQGVVIARSPLPGEDLTGCQILKWEPLIEESK